MSEEMLAKYIATCALTNYKHNPNHGNGGAVSVNSSAFTRQEGNDD